MILLDDKSQIIGQGVTGAEGSTALEWMSKYGTQIVAGVTPGKGGQTVKDLPVFNSVKEAVNQFPEVIGTVIYAPPLYVKSAAEEAINAGLKWLLIVTEKVPTQDCAYLYKLASENQANIIGPSSAGIINPTLKIKIGSIGGPAAYRAYVPGNIAVISKSGSMTSEISLHLKNHQLGVSWAVCIGGDRIIGTDFADFLLALESDLSTKAAVIFGELGGTYEERVAELVTAGKITKPIVAFIGGEFTAKLPSEVQFGHAGAIIEGDKGLPEHKRQVLESAGVKVAISLDEIAEIINSLT